MKSKPPFIPHHAGLVLALALIVLAPGSVNAQKVVTNDQGEKIVQFPDGSWRYYELSDSALLAPTSLIVPYQGEDVYNYRTFQRYTAAAVRNEANLMNLVSTTQAQYDELKDNVYAAEMSGDTALAEQRRKEADQLENTLQEERKALAQSRKMIRKILKIGKSEKYHKLAKLEVPGLDDMDKSLHALGTSSSIPSEGTPAEYTIREAGLNTTFSAEQETERLNGLDLTPKVAWSSRPQMVYDYKCNFSFEGNDPMNGQERKELDEELLLTHTDDKLKPYLHNRPYLSCSASLSSVDGGFRYLTLTFEITSRSARQEYGYIPKGSLLNLKLMNGKTVSLFAQGENHGTLDAKNATTTYRVKYPIDYQKEKLLFKSEVDKMRIIWSTGYEVYDVHNIDLIKNQLVCLNN